MFKVIGKKSMEKQLQKGAQKTWYGTKHCLETCTTVSDTKRQRLEIKQSVFGNCTVKTEKELRQAEESIKSIRTRFN